jgi:hypothetical protein
MARGSVNTAARAIAARCTTVAAVALAFAALAAGPATADSGEVQFSCRFDVSGEAQAKGTATAWFDTIIPDGLTVHVGDNFPLNPVVGTITFPDALTDLLRAKGITTIKGDRVGDMELSVDGTDHSWTPSLDLLDRIDRVVPLVGSMPVDVELTTESFRYSPTRAGTNNIVADRFYLPLNTGVGDGGALSCEALKGDFAIDTLQVADVATPTTTATPTATDARQVAQTDLAEKDSRAASPLTLGILAALTVGAIGLALRRQRAASHRN